MISAVVTDPVDARLDRLKFELSRLARDYCQEAKIESFVLPVGTNDLQVAFGTREQIARELDDSHMARYTGAD